MDNSVDKEAMNAFMQSISTLARTRDYKEVIAPFYSFEVIEDDWNGSGATFRICGKKIYNAVFLVVRGENPPYTSKPIISSASLLFDRRETSLSDIEAVFGEWYRDPPDGECVSLACAYFNPRRVVPDATYFLIADTTEGYVDKLNSSSPVGGTLCDMV